MDMTLKTKTMIIVALTCGILAGCKKYHPEGGIRFTASSGNSSITKTAYSGVEQDGKERIDWIVGDEFTIWSDKAVVMYTADRHDADYVIRSVMSTNGNGEADPNGHYSRATIEASEGNGLQWTNATGDYTFYARYPADPGTIDGTSMAGTIPDKWGQSGSPQLTWETETAGGVTTVVGKPDMNYACMFAKTTAARNASVVRLNFYPKFTAFTFVVGSGDNSEVNLTSFKLETLISGASIAGGFTLDCEDQNVSIGEGSSQSVTVNLVGKKVTPTSSLSFTVFALPVDLTGLRITFEGVEIGTRTLDLKYSSSSATPGSYITFGACKKYVIDNLRFPNLMISGGEDIEWNQEVSGEGISWDN